MPKRGPSLALVCIFCGLQKSLKEQRGAHLCKQVQKNLLTRRGGGTLHNIERYESKTICAEIKLEHKNTASFEIKARLPIGGWQREILPAPYGFV